LLLLFVVAISQFIIIAIGQGLVNVKVEQPAKLFIYSKLALFSCSHLIHFSFLFFAFSLVLYEFNSKQNSTTFFFVGFVINFALVCAF